MKLYIFSPTIWFLLLIFLTPQLILADPTPIDRRGGNIYPITDTDIRMEYEKITVKGCWDFEVNIVLINDGPDKEIEVGFPEWFNMDRGFDGSVLGSISELSRIRLLVDGKPVSLSKKVIKDEKFIDFNTLYGDCGHCYDSCSEKCSKACIEAYDIDDEELAKSENEYCELGCDDKCRYCCREEENYGDFGPYGVLRPGSSLGVDAVHLAKVAFPKEKRVKLTYTFAMSCLTMETYVEKTPLDYMLTTGAFWKGPIEKLEIDIELPGRPVHNDEQPFEVSLPKAKIVRQGKSYHVFINLENYEPDEDLHIDNSYSLDPSDYLPSKCFDDGLGGLEDINTEILEECCEGVYARHGLPVKNVPEEWLTLPLSDKPEYWSNPKASKKDLSDNEAKFLSDCKKLLLTLKSESISPTAPSSTPHLR